MKSGIKWGCIQPLTGGMYIGAENAIGQKADWVLSYPGLSDIKTDENGKITTAGNEYNLLKWCEKHNDIPTYQLFNKSPFESYSNVEDVEIIDDAVWTKGKVDFSNTDLVVSVPVCSGLSKATIAKDSTKDLRNNNMLFNAEYTLKVISPKIYIFENAPVLFSNAGTNVRDILNKLAQKYGYSICYYRTDTKYHDNVQKRKRTFVFFIKHRGNNKGCPEFRYEHITPTIQEYFSRIPKNATQNTPNELPELYKYIMDFVLEYQGENFRDEKGLWSGEIILRSGEKFYEWLDKCDAPAKIVDKLKRMADHMHEKREAGKNFYVVAPCWFNEKEETAPVCMFRMINSVFHYKENRMMTTREWLHLMGHPADFELYGDPVINSQKIGQNVPVRTAQFIVSEAVRIINEWNTIPRNNPEIYMFDNTKVKKTNTKKLF